MKNTNPNNTITKQDLKDIIKAANEKMESKWNKDIKILSKIVATKEDLKRFATKEDLKRFATKDDLGKLKTELSDEISNTKTGLAGVIVTKDYLDKKLYKLEESIIARTLNEKSKMKDALILVVGILRQGKKPDKEQIEALAFLEQELVAM